MVRYCSLYANTHRGKVRKTGLTSLALPMAEEKLSKTSSKGWAAMIRKVYEVDPLICPKCGGEMKVIAFIADYDIVESSIFLGDTRLSFFPSL